MDLNMFESGHRACAGCGAAIIMRQIVNTLGQDIIVVNPTGCMEIVSTPYPESAWRVPYVHSLFENAPAVASGIARYLRAKGNDHTRVVHIGGDGATYDIGFGALSGALERNEDCIFICYDTEIYSNCLSLDTLIMTENGPKNVTEIKEGEKIYAFDQRAYRPVLKKCTGVFNNGKQPLLKLETLHHDLKATANHPFLTLRHNGRGKTNDFVWKSLAQLKKGDEIVTLKRLDDGRSYDFKPIRLSKKGDYKVNKINPALIPKKSSNKLMELLGIYLGDGWTRLNKAEVGFSTPKNNKTRNRLIQLTKQVFKAKVTQTKNEVHIQSINAARFIDSLGFGKGAKSKTIPSWIFTLPSEEKTAFVEGLISSDGYVHKKTSIRYVSASYDLLRRLRLLLQTMNYKVGKIHWRKIKKGSYCVYRNLLKDTECGYICFSKKIGPNIEKYRSQRRYDNLSVENKYFDTERVKAVKLLTAEPTLDLRIEGEHNFIADGIVVHNTGVQRSGATPHFAATTTTPVGARFHGKPEQRKDIVGIVAAHNIPYVATASVGNIPDLKKKLLKAKAIRGSSFIVIYSTCTLGWRFDPAQTIKVAKLAIDTGAWPLYEIEKGNTTINVEPKWTPLEEYLKLQRRFKHLTKEEIEEFQKEIKARWDALKKQAQ